MGETERKCFIEDIPDETKVTGIFKVQFHEPRIDGFSALSPEIGMHVEIRDPHITININSRYNSTFIIHL